MKRQVSDEMIALYNKILDFCRYEPQRKYNIELEFNLCPKKLGSMLTILQKNKLIESEKINYHCCEYLTVEGAKYKTNDVPKQEDLAELTDKARKKKLNITVIWNKTIVRMNSYHTTAGLTQKHEWRGYSSLEI